MSQAAMKEAKEMHREEALKQAGREVTSTVVPKLGVLDPCWVP